LQTQVQDTSDYWWGWGSGAEYTRNRTIMAKKKPKKTPKGGSNKAAVVARLREEKAIKLRLQGLTLQEIAAEVGYASRGATRDAILRAMARIPNPENAAELRQREVDKCDEIERELWEQWYRSTDDAVKQTTKTPLAAVVIDGETGDIQPATTSAGDKPEISRTVEGQSGNTSLVDKILKAMERRSKLLGLDAPVKLQQDTTNEVRVCGLEAADVFEAAAKRLRGG
jgi:hypothetical protein